MTCTICNGTGVVVVSAPVGPAARKLNPPRPHTVPCACVAERDALLALCKDMEDVAVAKLRHIARKLSAGEQLSNADIILSNALTDALNAHTRESS